MEVLLKCFNEESWSHQGKHYTIPPDVDYRGYQLTRHHLRAAPDPPAGRDLDADRQRQDASLHRPAAASRRMVTLNGENIFDQVARAYRTPRRPRPAAS